MWQPRASVIVACLLVLFAVPGRAEDEAEDPLFEVLVVGTFHAPWLFRSRHLHPGHVRAALEAAKPDVVGVESNPEWFAKGIFHDVTYEAQGVAVPWAKAREIPVYGIDWMDVAAWEAREEEREKQRAGAIRVGGPPPRGLRSAAGRRIPANDGLLRGGRSRGGLPARQ